MSGSYKRVMAGPVPPARPKPLRRGEGPGIHEGVIAWRYVDGRDKPGHDDNNHVVLNCNTPSFVSAVSRPSTIM